MQNDTQAGGIKQNINYNVSYTLKDPDHDEIKDGYQLRWVGKDYAKLQENLRPETVIVPDSEHNAKSSNKDSQNLFLTGDNLEVLKHLEHAYTGKVDMIYIDPPYNTGSDGFVYNDNFGFTNQQLRDTLGLTETEVERIKNIYGKASHSAWLTFMYPRLRIAKKLLKETGVIFVSIDDNEQANLKLLMDEIFNEGEFVGTLIHQRAKGGGMAKNFVNSHDYIHVYARDIEQVDLKQKKIIQSKTVWINGEEFIVNDDLYRRNFGGKIDRSAPHRCYFYEEIEQIKGKKEKEYIDSEVEAGRYLLKPYKNGMHLVARYEKVSESYSKVYGIIKYLSEEGKAEVDELLGENIFSYPKPVDLVKLLVEMSTQQSKNDCCILDFFSGSGTTAHAVMKLNKEDDGKRRYIMATLDEDVKPKSEAAKAGYKTIDMIARKRIDLAAEKMGDTSGYRHYRFVKPGVQTLEQIEDFDPEMPKLVADDMLTPFSEKSLTSGANESGVPTILTTWLVDDGYSFDTTAERLDLAGYSAYYAPEIARLYLIESEDWSIDACKALLNALGKNDIAVNSIVVYSYSFDFTSLTELKNNIKSNLDGKPQVIERY